MLVPAALPAITPPPILSGAAHAALVGPRQVSWDLGGYNRDGGNDDCLYNGAYANGVAECSNIIYSCNGIATDVNYASNCFCTYGMSYLDCFYDKMSTCATYIFGTLDWQAYQMSYFTNYCGSIPPSAFAQMTAPTAVALTFATARIATKPGHIAVPTDIAPIYQGTGQLLAGACSESTDFQLVNAGATEYVAGFVGCNKNRPECCPWQVGDATKAAAAAATGATATDSTGTQNQNHNDVDLPLPADNAQAVLVNCAGDYYSVSGACCPVGYWRFTTEVAGQTPCYSSVNRMSVPTVTVGADDQKAKDTSKPTSAVVNIVWSMSYPVQDSSTKSGLSTGATAGIGVGVGIAGIALVGLGAWLFMRNRKKKQQVGEKGTPQAATGQAIPQQPPPQQMQPPVTFGYPQPMQPNMQQPQMMMMQQPNFVPNGQYSVSTGSISAPGMTTPSDGASLVTTMSVSPANEYKAFSNGAYPAPIAEVDEAPTGQQQQYHAYAQQQQQQQPQQPQQPGVLPSQFNTVPGVPIQGQGLGQQQQQQQQQVYPQNGSISPQELAPGQQQQFSQQTGSISPQELAPGQQQQFSQQPGPISPQELGPGQQQQLYHQTDPMLLPGQPYAQYFPPGTVQPPTMAPGQVPQQQMVWNQAAGGYVLAQQQSPPYQGSPPPAGS